MHVMAILQTKGSHTITTRADATIAEVSRLLVSHRIGAALVTAENGDISGIISERDIVNGLAVHGAAVGQLQVQELMTREVLSCKPTDSIAGIMAIMTSQRVRHLPVMEEGRLVGIISIGDVVKHRLDEAAMEVDSLRDYVMAGR